LDFNVISSPFEVVEQKKSMVITNSGLAAAGVELQNFSKFLGEQPENSVERNRSWGPHYFSVRQNGYAITSSFMGEFSG